MSYVHASILERELNSQQIRTEFEVSAKGKPLWTRRCSMWAVSPTSGGGQERLEFGVKFNFSPMCGSTELLIITHLFPPPLQILLACRTESTVWTSSRKSPLIILSFGSFW